MFTARTWLRSTALSAAVLAAASCTDGGAGGITAPAGELATSSTGPTLIECPSDVTYSASDVIGATGGAVTVGDHQLVIPPLAVTAPTQFTVTVPASQYMEVDIRAGGQEHYRFDRPVTMTLSYARCTRTNIDKENLRIFYVDTETDAILEDMGGVDDKAARTVTTDTDHLSGYVIGQG